ncbi:hypothetical protein PoB_007212100 [Plakobranchus ocellatus]|uniref:Uncharacterized protein n=1 Tax=Plakobranchus ocellatus TaxID=259542 RepID=A0AAV4DP23_9GAST|nr:hypothetical protein PoB_007212100 [Plakobranchus ocellatus]
MCVLAPVQPVYLAAVTCVETFTQIAERIALTPRNMETKKNNQVQGVTVSTSSLQSHALMCSIFPWDDRGDGRSTDTTLLNPLTPVLVAHGLLTQVILPAT